MRIKQTILVLLALLVPLQCHYAQADYSWIETETAADKVDRIYGAEEDAISIAEANALLLKLTNETRQLKDARELTAHSLASWIAQDHAEEMAKHRYLNHHDLNGRKVEMRFNNLGQTDHVTENVVYSEINFPVCLTRQFVRRLHEYWVTSESHLDNIMHPTHTHLGSGFAIEHDGETTVVSGVAIFVNDYGDYDRLPKRLPPGSTLKLEGYLDPERTALQFIGLGSEELPFVRDTEYQLDHMGPYSQPPLEFAFMPRQYLGRLEPKVEKLRYTVDYDEQTGAFSLEIKLARDNPKAAVYLTVWAKETSGDNCAFRAMTQVVLVE